MCNAFKEWQLHVMGTVAKPFFFLLQYISHSNQLLLSVS